MLMQVFFPYARIHGWSSRDSLGPHKDFWNPPFFFYLKPSYSVLTPQSPASSDSPNQSLCPRLKESAILWWGPFPARGSSKSLQASSQVDYRACVISLASLRDRIPAPPIVQCLQIVISYVFFSSGFRLVYSRRTSLLPVALSFVEVKVCLFPSELLNYLTALTSCRQSSHQLLKFLKPKETASEISLQWLLRGWIAF